LTQTTARSYFVVVIVVDRHARGVATPSAAASRARRRTSRLSVSREISARHDFVLRMT
jgi:hypothetical protein